MRVYVVDGYNVVFSEPRYRDVAARDIDSARARLVGDVAAYVHGDGEAIIVFDGATNPESSGEPHATGGTTVVFSPFGVDADTVIEQTVAGRTAAGDEVRLVTSDEQTQWVALGYGALRISSAGFVRDVQDAALSDSEHAFTGSSRGALDERIDPGVRDALARWARGR